MRVRVFDVCNGAARIGELGRLFWQIKRLLEFEALRRFRSFRGFFSNGTEYTYNITDTERLW